MDRFGALVAACERERAARGEERRTARICAKLADAERQRGTVRARMLSIIQGKEVHPKEAHPDDEQSDAEWYAAYSIFRAYVVATGDQRPTVSTTYSGCLVGIWVAMQRCFKAAGTLQHNRTMILGAHPGWRWDMSPEAYWSAMYYVLTQYAEGHGRPPPEGARMAGARIGDWVSAQREAYARGSLPPPLVRAIEQTAGWTW